MQRSQAVIDPAALIAIGAIAVGWFAMSTLVADFGLIGRTIRFYELLNVINDPAGRLSGMDAPHPLVTVGFTLACIVALAACCAPVFSSKRAAWLSYLVPFILMACSFAVLYAKTSASQYHTDDAARGVTAHLARIAARVALRTGDLAAQRISVGAGAYVALVGSAFLAVWGVIKFRRTKLLSAPIPPQVRI